MIIKKNGLFPFLLLVFLYNEESMTYEQEGDRKENNGKLIYAN